MKNGKKVAAIAVGCALLGQGLLSYGAPITEITSADTEISQKVITSSYGPAIDSRSSTQFVLQSQSNSTTFNAALFYFDLSAYAGQKVTADGTFTVYSTFSDNAITANLSEVTVEWKGLPTGQATYENLGNILGAQLGTGAIAKNSGGQFKAVTFVVPKATIQSWIDSPAMNYGLGLNFIYQYPNNPFSSVYLNALEGNVNYRPKLAFDAVAVPESASLGLLSVGGLLFARRR